MENSTQEFGPERAHKRVKTFKKNGRLVEICLEDVIYIVGLGIEFGLTEEWGKSIVDAMRILFVNSRGYRSTEKTKVLAKEANRVADSKVEAEESPAAPIKPKPKRQGRNGINDYPISQTNSTPHPSLKKGDRCPCGCGGKLGDFKPRRTLRISGRCPLVAESFEQEGLRCSLCGEVFRAPLPEDAGTQKYDATAVSTLAILRYGAGLPFNRQAALYALSGFPMPVATQYTLVSDPIGVFEPVYKELQRLSAQADQIGTDDTKGRILDAERKDEFAKRTGIHTTGTVVELGPQRIAIFQTGVKHAGENLDDLLEKRADGLSVPVIMSDALSRNSPKRRLSEGVKILVANCLAHGRRKFVDIVNSFPDECFHVLESLGRVYLYDKQSKAQGMDPEARLRFHQLRSAPVMESLLTWMNAQLVSLKAEPNSRLGKAIRYMTKRWDKLTVFLRTPGAALDNNLVERALKRVVLHRKNSLFYRTENGAKVGDIYLSLIHTCQLNGVNSFDYLTALQRNAVQVASEPGRWLPWNYSREHPVIQAAA